MTMTMPSGPEDSFHHCICHLRGMKTRHKSDIAHIFEWYIYVTIWQLSELPWNSPCHLFSKEIIKLIAYIMVGGLVGNALQMGHSVLSGLMTIQAII